MEIEKHYKLTGNLSKVKIILRDLKYYGELHPLIKSVKKVETGITDNHEYRIKERPYNWIPIQIKYSARVKSNDNKIEYQIKGLPFTDCQIRYEINQLVDEEIDLNFKLKIEGKLIGKGILMRKMVKAQDALIKSINEELANPKLLK